MKNSLNRTRILITVIFMDLLAGMEVDLFIPSFPELQSCFNLSTFWLEALLSINFVGFCLSLFLVGSLADHYGRKPILLIGMMIFIMGTIMCLGGSYLLIFVGRFFQGVGVAAPSILSFLIIADIYPLKKQQYLMAMLNGLINISIGLAPVIGSYITMYFHWQGNFIALLILALITLMMTLIFIPVYKIPKSKEPLSLQAYMILFQSKPLMLLIMTLIFIFLPYWIFVGMSPLLYMKDLGVSLNHFGYYQGAIALIFAVGSIIYGFVIDKYDQRKILYLTNFIFIISLVLLIFTTFSNSSNPLLITSILVIFCIGQIMPSTLLYPLCLNFIPEAKGRVSAMIQGFRLMITAFSLQVAGYFYQGSFRNIGIIIFFFISFAIVTLFYVLNNKVLMNELQKK